MDMKLELVAIPVTDVDRAKAFYADQVGFNADQDHQVSDDLRFVQLTPPGSGCSIALGTGITEMALGSQKGLQLVVETSKINDMPWGRFVFFSDPDGNTWAVQQLPPRP